MTLHSIYLPPHNLNTDDFGDPFRELPHLILLSADFNDRHHLWRDTLCSHRGCALEYLFCRVDAVFLNCDPHTSKFKLGHYPISICQSILENNRIRNLEDLNLNISKGLAAGTPRFPLGPVWSNLDMVGIGKGERCEIEIRERFLQHILAAVKLTKDLRNHSVLIYCDSRSALQATDI